MFKHIPYLLTSWFLDPPADAKEISLQAAVRGLVSSVAAALKDHGIEYSDVLSYKVFHSQAHIPQDTISPGKKSKKPSNVYCVLVCINNHERTYAKCTFSDACFS